MSIQKANSRFLYIHSLSKHLPNVIKQLMNSIHPCLMRTYETQQNVNTKMLWRKVGWKLIFEYTKNQQQKPKIELEMIFQFNLPFNKAVSTNVAKTFFQLINGHFLKPHILHKIFNRNTVKVSYSCMESMAKIYKRHNSKIISILRNQLTLCNCQVK